MSNPDEFVERAKAQLDQWSDELKSMQAKMESAGAEGQAKMKEQMAALDAQREQAEEMFQKIAKANVSAWKDMQAGFEGAWQQLEKSFDAARKRYKD